jgi:tRNA dimethylallyltransferase
MCADAMPSHPALILIVGPTGVGKTDLAIQLAETLSGEIISADSRLFYRGMDIGTAKPPRQKLQQVPHHLIDIVNPNETLSLAVFQRKARDAISNVHRRGRLPLLVGGTGQYVRAVTEDWQPPAVAPDTRLRDELGRLKDEKGVYWLHDRLQQLDPDAAREIDPRNVRRTIRALEVILTTGTRFSTQRVRGQSPYHLITIGLNRPRSDLYARIDARIDAMFEAGLLEEVRGLLEAGYSPDLPAMSAIGYRECVRVIQGEWDIERANAEMRRATRMYVRRQANWFKQSDPAIRWFDAVQPGLAASLADLIRKILHDSSI